MDDMDDSLFEGMVLFDPSSSSSQFPVDDNKHDDSVEPPPKFSQQPPQSPTPAATTTAGASFEPLDENLFSDLTLVQPQSQNDDVFSSSLDPHPVSPSSSSTSSRSTIDVATTTTTFASPSQTLIAVTSSNVSNSRGVVPLSRSLSSQISSTRKKKKAGLRIGYGRAAQSPDSTIDVDDTLPQSSSPPVVVAEENVKPVEEKHQKQTIPDSEISSDSIIPEATTSSEEKVKTVEEKHQKQIIPDSEISSDSIIPEATTSEQDITQVQNTEMSIESRYDQIKKQIADKLDCAHQTVASVSAKRKDFVRQRRKAAEALNLASVKHKEMEKELEEAVESEDFETAERVSDSLASAEKNKELLLIALREAEADCDAIDNKMQEALELQIVAEEECAGLLESFAVDADHEADSVISNAETKMSEVMKNWLSLSESLEIKKIEAEIESHVLSGARQILNDSIDQVVKDDKQESQLLHNKKTILAKELQQLLDLVKQKETEISENDSKIENIEKRMSDAVSSFHEAQSNINLKNENIQSGLSRLELENDELARKKKQIDDFTLQEETRGLKIKKLGQISADEARVYQEVVHMRKSLIELILKSREDKTRLAKTEQKLFDDVQTLKHDISDVRASLQDLSSTKSGTQQTIESSKQRLLFIEKRVPEIESEKRVATTARNFKEAARIANEAKTLYIEKETLQLKIKEAMTNLKKIEDDINHNVEILQKKEENISLNEKKLETVRYQRLILVGSAAMAERSAAMEMGDDEEADILLTEARNADFEAKKIRENGDVDEFDCVAKSFVSMELVSSFDKKQLAELAEVAELAASSKVAEVAP